MEKNYDIVIIGAGPAGLTAAVYAARYKLKTIVIGEMPGGTINQAHKVGNFPSYTSISGIELGQKMAEQVKENGVEIFYDKISEITKKNELFNVKGHEAHVSAKKVILAIGTKRRTLNLPREKDLIGKGVSYCATCDGLFFKNKVVGVIGGSDAALSEALYLAEVAKKVYIIYRKASFFRAEPKWVEMVEKNKKIEPVFESNVTELLGEKKLEGVKLDTGKKLELDGLFIEIGSDPEKDFFEKIGLKVSKNGYVVVDREMRTSIKGILSAGELNEGTFRQAIVACAEGAIATHTAYEEIKEDESKKEKK